MGTQTLCAWLTPSTHSLAMAAPDHLTSKVAADALRRLAAAQPQPKGTAGLYVGLIERLMTLSTRLGIAYEPGVENFGASIEDRLYAICRSTERLLDSLSTQAPAPGAAPTDEQIRDALEAEFLGEPGRRNLADDLRVARAVLGIVAPCAAVAHRPLTEEQVFKALEEEARRLNGGTLDGLQMNPEMLSEVIKIFRIAERAHGIKEASNG